MVAAHEQPASVCQQTRIAKSAGNLYYHLLIKLIEVLLLYVNVQVVWKLNEFWLANRGLAIDWQLAQIVLAPPVNCNLFDFWSLCDFKFCAELDGLILPKDTQSFSEKLVALCHMFCQDGTCDFAELYHIFALGKASLPNPLHKLFIAELRNTRGH